MPQKMRQEKISTISSLYILTWFKYFLIYILRQNVPKIRQVKFWNTSSLHAKFSLPKCSNTPILYATDALKALLSKNWFYFFLLIF